MYTSLFSFRGIQIFVDKNKSRRHKFSHFFSLSLSLFLSSLISLSLFSSFSHLFFFSLSLILSHFFFIFLSLSSLSLSFFPINEFLILNNTNHFHLTLTRVLFFFFFVTLFLLLFFLVLTPIENNG